jgi:molecular chaperone DnaK
MGAVIGIDLGTTNTVVAAIRDGNAVALPDESGATLIPSIVSFLPSGAVLVGSAARERRSEDVLNTVYSVKRLIGRTWDSPEVERARSTFPFQLREGPGRTTFIVARGETYTLPEISAFVLRKAKSIAELELGESVDRAVITVPANFNDLQRAATKVAGRVAGLEILRIINEPTAAALAFGHTEATDRCIAVYDLGGGTFDFTVLRLTSDVFEVLSTAGDSFLGGDDIDAEVLEQMADRFIAEGHADPRGQAEGIARLRDAAERLKTLLTTEPDGSVRLNELGIVDAPAVDFLFTRRDLDSATRGVVERSIGICRNALATAKLTVADIEEVLLVGGSTKDPYVRRRISDFFGRAVRCDIDPHEVVAIGAARHAETLTQTRATASGIPLPPISRGYADPSGTVHARPTEAEVSPSPQAESRPKTRPFGEPHGELPALAEPASRNAANKKLETSANEPWRTDPRNTKGLAQSARRTTGLGLGPIVAEAPLPLIEGRRPAPPVSVAQGSRTTEPAFPPSTLSGLGPKDVEEAGLPVIKDSSPRATHSREKKTAPAMRVAAGTKGDAPIAPDLSNTLASEARPAHVPLLPLSNPAQVAHQPHAVRRAPPPKPRLDVPEEPPKSPALPQELERVPTAPSNSWDLDDAEDAGWDDLPAASAPVQSPGGNPTARPSQGHPGALPLVVSGMSRERTLLSAIDRDDASTPQSEFANVGRTFGQDLPMPADIGSRADWDPLPTPPNRAPGAGLDAGWPEDVLAQPLHEVGEDDPTVVRRAQDPTPELLDFGFGATLNSETFGSPPSSRSPGPQSSRPISLNEEELRARYGNLPLIVGGKRVGAGQTLGSAVPQVNPKQATTQMLATPVAPVRQTTGSPLQDRPGDPRTPEMQRQERPAATPRGAFSSRHPEGVEFERGAERRAESASNSFTDGADPRSSKPAPGRFTSSRPAARQDASLEADLPIPDVPPSSRRPPPQAAPFLPFAAVSAAAGHPATAPMPAATPRTAPTAFAQTSPNSSRATAPSAPEASPSFGVTPQIAPRRTADLLASFGAAQSVPLTSAVAPPSPAWNAKGVGPTNTLPLGAAIAGGSAMSVVSPSSPLASPPRSRPAPALLIDVTPLSLCVETAGGYCDVLVARNTPVPCERTRDFVTVQDNQETVIVRVAQGESAQFEENVLLGEVQLPKLTAAPRGQLRISVTFSLDSDGLLQVRALDVATGQSARAELQLVGAPTSPEMQQMIARNRGKSQ